MYDLCVCIDVMDVWLIVFLVECLVLIDEVVWIKLCEGLFVCIDSWVEEVVLNVCCFVIEVGFDVDLVELLWWVMMEYFIVQEDCVLVVKGQVDIMVVLNGFSC